MLVYNIHVWKKNNKHMLVPMYNFHFVIIDWVFDFLPLYDEDTNEILHRFDTSVYGTTNLSVKCLQEERLVKTIY